MGKLIFPIKEMPEVLDNQKIYLRKYNQWVSLDAVPSDVIPAEDATKKLGSDTKRFTDLYVTSDGAIHLGQFVIQEEEGILKFFIEGTTDLPDNNLKIATPQVVVEDDNLVTTDLENALREVHLSSRTWFVQWDDENNSGYSLGANTTDHNFPTGLEEVGRLYTFEFQPTNTTGYEDQRIFIDQSDKFRDLQGNELLTGAVDGQTVTFVWDGTYYVELFSSRTFTEVNPYLIADQAEAQAFVEGLEDPVNNKYMTPLRTKQAVAHKATRAELITTDNATQHLVANWDEVEGYYYVEKNFDYNNNAVITISFLNTISDSTPATLVFGEDSLEALMLYDYNGVQFSADLIDDKTLTFVYTYNDTEEEHRLDVTPYSYKVYEATGEGLDQLQTVVRKIFMNARVEAEPGDDQYVFYNDLNVTSFQDGTLLTIKFPDDMDITNTLTINMSIANSLGNYYPLDKEDGSNVLMTDLYDQDPVSLVVTGRTMRVSWETDHFVVFQGDIDLYNAAQKDGQVLSMQLNKLEPFILGEDQNYVGTESAPYYEGHIATVNATTIESTTTNSQNVNATDTVNADVKVTTPRVETSEVKVTVSEGVYKDYLSPDITISATYVPLIADHESQVFYYSNTTGADIVVTVPNNTTVEYPIGTQIGFIRGGLGNLSFNEEDVSVTINSSDLKRYINKQFSSAALMKVDTNTWVLVGDLTAEAN